MARILVADDEELMREPLVAMLRREGHDVVAVVDGAAASDQLTGGEFDLLLTDLRMPRMPGLQLLGEAKKLRPDMPVVLMTAYATVSTAVEAMKAGAYDYIQKPFDADEVKALVDRTLDHSRLARENAALKSLADEASAPRPLIGSGAAMMAVRDGIERIARSRATVLIRGESGTGKEVVARAIHAASDRAGKPMLTVNCAALSEAGLASELFGHERGAFLGADDVRRGRFELADGGTLLLDEVGEIAIALQPKLLRVLQEGAFERLGSGVPRRVDVRVIATTNRDLEAAVNDGSFRADLFYRLDVVPLQLAPLRDRIEDVPDLARHFVQTIARRENKPARHIEPEAVRLLQKYQWPGNVRELRNIIERACVLETNPAVLTAGLIEPWLKNKPAVVLDAMDGKPLADIEKQVILRTLQQFKGHRMKTAGALGIGVRTLGIKLKRWRDEGQLIEVGADS